MCQMHYTRWRRYGNPQFLKRLAFREPVILSPVEAAYLAAFLDGEGSVVLTNQARGRIALSWYNTDLPNMEYIAQILKVNIYKIPQRSQPKSGKVALHIRIANRNARNILRQLLPYMHNSKKVANAKEWLKQCEDLDCGHTARARLDKVN